MVELLGALLGVAVFALGLLLWRLLRQLRRALALLLGRAAPGHRTAALKGVRLRASRALARSQSDRIATLSAELERVRRDLRLARAAAPGEDRFRRAKQAFALHFHPDRLACAEPERGIRTGIFQQFWGVLRKIEKS